MNKESRLFELAFEWYVSSYYLTKRQRQIGRRLSLGPVNCVHYDYEWEGEKRTADNFFVKGADPETVVATIRAYGPAVDHQLFVVADRPGLSIAYMSLGCSAMTGVNTLMARGMDSLPKPARPLQLFQPKTPGETMYLNAIDGVDLTLAEDVIDPDLTFYYANAGDKPVSMARVARKKQGLGWVSHVYTAPDHRRQGLATAIMTQVLNEQTRAGDRLSLLLATQDAQGMYRKLGYLNIVPVLNFVLN